MVLSSTGQDFDRPWVAAFGGCAGPDHPAHSWPAILQAAEENADLIAVDLWRTRDGVAVAAPHARIGADAPLCELLWEELRVLGEHEPPRLEALLAWSSREGVRLLLNLRDPALDEIVPTRLAGYADPELVGVASVHAGLLERLGRDGWHTTLALGAVLAPRDCAHLALRVRAHGVWLRWEQAAPTPNALLHHQLVDFLRTDRGLAVLGWPTDAPCELAVQAGVGLDVVVATGSIRRARAAIEALAEPTAPPRRASNL